MEKNKIAIYPGCSLETSSAHYLKSLKTVFNVLNLPFKIIEDWSCCGATSVKSIDQKLNLLLNARNLALAENQGIKELIVPCASCYHRLLNAEYELNNDEELKKKINEESGFNYQGKVKVRNILDFFINVTGLELIEKNIKKPLKGLNIACYYGCLNTRIPREKAFDVREYPMTMDKLLKALGADVIDWSYKTECCGASLFITVNSVSEKLVGKILKDASLRDVDCVAVTCPMCQTNLDTKQDIIRKKFSIQNPLPVPFITQLMGLAFGCKPKDLGLKKNFVPVKLLNEKIDLL